MFSVRSVLLHACQALFIAALVFPVQSEAGGNTARGKRLRPDSLQAPVEVVFCLDLSGSTNGVVNDLRDQFWLIVNTIQAVQPQSELRMGLVGFSRPSFGKESGYVRLLCPITPELDQVEAELYKLKPYIEKGDQYVSAALKVAVNDLRWSSDSGASKMVFLVGNGMVQSGGYDFVKFSEQARMKNIRIHSLYARRTHNLFKELPGWKRIASISGGRSTDFRVMTHDSITVWPSEPDSMLRVLNEGYNQTLLWCKSDSALFHKSLLIADSGAYFSSSEAWHHRLYYKTGDGFVSRMITCEDHPLDNMLASSDADGAAYEEKRKRDCEVVQQRTKLQWEIRRKLPAENFEELVRRYMKGALREEDILHRCIIRILFAELGSYP
jgi:hypothetical protein